MSFDDGQEYKDTGNGYKAYYYDSSLWREISALPADGGSFSAAALDITTSITLENEVEIYGENTVGTPIQFAKMNSSNDFILGSASADMRLNGIAFYINTDVQQTDSSPIFRMLNTAETSSAYEIQDSANSAEYAEFGYHAGTNVGFVDTNSTLDFRINGTDEVQITSVQVVIPSNNFQVSDGKANLFCNNVADVCTDVYATNASFGSGGAALRVKTKRAGNSAFNMAVFDSNDGADREFRFRGDGNGTCDGSWTGGGADFAELMEWEDGNPNNEDRVGRSVVVVPNPQGKPLVRLAQSGDIPHGVVSASPTVVGNSDWNKWQGKHKKDKFGRCKKEPVAMVRWTEAETIESKRADEAAQNETALKARPEYQVDTGPIKSKIASFHSQLIALSSQLEKIKVDYSIDDRADKSQWSKKRKSEKAALQAERSILIEQKQNAVFDIRSQIKSLEEQLQAASRVQKAVEREQEKRATAEAAPPKNKDVDRVFEVAKLGNVVPPQDAIYYTEERRIVSAAFDPERQHEAREERQEWDTIGLVGLVVIEDGQPVDPRWVNLGPCGDGVSRWLIR